MAAGAFLIRLTSALMGQKAPAPQCGPLCRRCGGSGRCGGSRDLLLDIVLLGIL